ncbi:LexA family protein [Xenorhabdus griffiniae]|uniref:XRE family transcriptional regulator n=1 Tax=Xenorhabdus griffiniae TaxID=351672 RepID=A0ABY9XL57_9GAMM|nr:XRE family transcriptional regulator [Xenorhabdus griffiniae]MBD1228649.1 LexA family transcriptional regulator [Xenorhabdus griffiniae]MBE8588201.1 LexA family transcriptional regulator [Xenorhabdus griffiniae]WMV73546.1 XRE family transcriptional regulator [Xenorhabdus griffiniae]WNH03226.1 XRE family transcriptional regulator [Xenorhabdus griffiniae]
MNIDDNFKTRISMARQAANLTQGELADKVGVVRRQIAAYEAGDSKPRDNVLTNLAAALGTSREWLAIGVGDEPDLGNIRKTVTTHEIPVMEYYSDVFSTIGFTASGIGHGSVLAPPNASSDCFAVKISGDSMESESGLSFPEGTVVIFDRNLTAQNGDFVFTFSITNGDSMVRQVFFDQGKWYLRPLNASYEIMPFNRKDFEVIGIAVQSQFDIHSKRDSLPIHITKKNSHLKEMDKKLSSIHSMLEQLLNK